MYRTARDSLAALVLAGAIALAAPSVAQASSASPQPDHDWSYPAVIEFRWSIAQFELDPETGHERERIVTRMSPWFLAFDSGWQQVGDQTVPPTDHWTPPWAWPFSDSNRWTPGSFDGVPWDWTFDEWLQHLPATQNFLPLDPVTDDPIVPEPFLASTLLAAGAGAVAILRRRRVHRAAAFLGA